MSPQSTRRAITADLIRAASDIALMARPELRSLLDQLTAKAAESIASLTAAPFRLSFDGLAEGPGSLPPAEARHIASQSNSGPLDAWLVCDRGFIVALSDLCFGGSGKDPAAESEDRPLSKIELRLRQTLYADLAGHLPALFAETLGVRLSQAAAAGPTLQEPEAKSATVVYGRILLTAFGYSGELRLVFPRQALLKLFQARLAAHAAKPNAAVQPIAAQVAQTTVELTFALPAQPITLEALGTMHLGQLIRLAANVHDPVQVTSRGIKLFDAGLSFGGNRMAFELFEPAAAKTTANSLERGG